MPSSHFPAWQLSSHFATAHGTESTFLTWSSALWYHLPLLTQLSVPLSLYSQLQAFAPRPSLLLTSFYCPSEGSESPLLDGSGIAGPSHADPVVFPLLCSPPAHTPEFSHTSHVVRAHPCVVPAAAELPYPHPVSTRVFQGACLHMLVDKAKQ